MNRRHGFAVLGLMMGLTQISGALATEDFNISECYEPTPMTCGFYRDCLEPAITCGPTGYALGYGERYCTKFQNIKDSLSDDGQAWVS